MSKVSSQITQFCCHRSTNERTSKLVHIMYRHPSKLDLTLPTHAPKTHVNEGHNGCDGAQLSSACANFLATPCTHQNSQKAAASSPTHGQKCLQSVNPTKSPLTQSGGGSQKRHSRACSHQCLGTCSLSEPAPKVQPDFMEHWL